MQFDTFENCVSTLSFTTRTHAEIVKNLVTLSLSEMNNVYALWMPYRPT